MEEICFFSVTALAIDNDLDVMNNWIVIIGYTH